MPITNCFGSTVDMHISMACRVEPLRCTHVQIWRLWSVLKCSTTAQMLAVTHGSKEASEAWILLHNEFSASMGSGYLAEVR